MRSTVALVDDVEVVRVAVAVGPDDPAEGKAHGMPTQRRAGCRTVKPSSAMTIGRLVVGHVGLIPARSNFDRLAREIGPHEVFHIVFSTGAVPAGVRWQSRCPAPPHVRARDHRLFSYDASVVKADDSCVDRVERYAPDRDRRVGVS